ncbi:MAG: DMT family transporter [Gammaproteobacteria bacterium]
MNAEASPGKAPPHSTRLKGIFAMLIAVGAFASMDTMLKVLSHRYPPLQLASLRAAASIPFLVIPALLMGRLATLKPVRLGWHLLRGLLGVLLFGAFVYAVRVLSLADTYAIYLSAPLLITALSVPLLKEHVGWRRWIAIGVGLCGVLVMLRPSGSNLMTLGAVAALIAAVAYSFSAITLRMLTRTESTSSVVLWPFVVMMVVSALLSAREWVTILPNHWLWFAGIGAVGALASRMLTEAFRAAPPSVVAPFEYSALLWGVAIDWVVWNVLPSSRVLAGGALVIASGLYIIWRERQLHLAHIAAVVGGSGAAAL